MKVFDLSTFKVIQKHLASDLSELKLNYFPHELTIKYGDDCHTYQFDNRWNDDIDQAWYYEPNPKTTNWPASIHLTRTSPKD